MNLEERLKRVFRNTGKVNKLVYEGFAGQQTCEFLYPTFA
jgi:hypothetical protein